MTLRGCEVLIIGGGVAGLAAAAALIQRGARVQICEASADFGQVGAGLQISPNGARVIDALGGRGGLTKIAMRSAAVRLRDGRTGRPVLDLDLTDAGPGFHLIHRADLIDLLVGLADGARIRLGTSVTAVDLLSTHPSVTLATGEKLTADLILGADGLHSRVRPALQPREMSPGFTGQVAWRALIPTGSTQPDAVAEVFMGPGRHLVSYPLRDGELRNLVAVEERSAWAQEGWRHPDDPANLRAAFTRFSDPVRAWLDQVDEVWLWGLFRHPVAERWHGAAAALLGDAAHPTLPFMAQGANLALEDAWVLAREVERGTDLTQGLAAYQARRRVRVAKVVEVANRNARNYHLRPPLAQIAHALLRVGGRLRPDAALRRFDWIYGHDVTAA